MIKIQSLNQNKQFLNILKKNKLSNDYFTIYFGKNNYGVCKKKNNLNISFVIKKKIGTAVKRNKIKRKLKSAVQKILIDNKTINLRYAYIIFGKTSAYNEKFPIICNEIGNVFRKIKNLNS
jgi:ribonuclease P protein component